MSGKKSPLKIGSKMKVLKKKSVVEIKTCKMNRNIIFYLNFNSIVQTSLVNVLSSANIILLPPNKQHIKFIS